MINDKRLLAVILARGGSKRLPRKNLLNFSGKPLVSWSIEAGLQSKYVDRVIVSTDSEEIADITREFNIDVPFMRPEELASDTATSLDVIHHVVNELKKSNTYFEYILLLQPTSPLRTAKHIDEAIELLLQKNADGIVSVCELDHPVEWTNILPEDRSLSCFLKKEFVGLRSQDFPLRYRINGAIYLSKTSILLKNSTFFSDNSYAYIMEAESSIDIDDKYDFVLGECISKKNIKGI